ncbi:ankyrin-1-like isoform X3 [Lineus longissimus]|uniref:ankyrin-1-like isoform X3 n=1 Tax=Lineus longissimus TaxID=88925 RepID=UPI00315CABD3
MASPEKSIVSRRDTQGQRKILKIADRKGKVHLVPSTPHFQALVQLNIFSRKSCNGSSAEKLSACSFLQPELLERTLSAVKNLDADSYLTSDPVSLKLEMKLMSSTLLHCAVLNEQRERVEELLLNEKGARGSVDKYDRTALHIAALIRDPQMVTSLADSKDIDRRDMFGKSPLYLAAESGNTENVSIMMELGAEPDTVDMFGLSPIFAAIRGRWLETVNLLLSKDVDINRQCKIGAAPIHFAALNGDIEIVRVLLDKGAKANLVDKMEATPLILAARFGNIKVGLKLLEVYTPEDVRKANMDGDQAIHFAVTTDNLELVETLIDRGADKDAKNEFGFTPLHFAVLSRNLPAVTFLVKKAGVNVNAVDKDGNQAIHFAVTTANLELVETLIDRGADKDAKNEFGFTPLHLAVLSGNLLAVSFLVKKAGVNVNAADKMLNTPMDLAAQGDETELISLLKKYGGRKGPRKQVPVTGKEQKSLTFPQVAATDALAVHQTPPETENPGPCSDSSPSELQIRTEDPRLRPILKKVDVTRMVNDLENLLKDAGAEVLTQKNIVFRQRNFAMGVIGPKGGRLAFADESVTMTIPPGALSDTRVISCFRPIGPNGDDQGRQPNKDWIFCTPELICGPDGTKFNTPITIRFRHSIHVGEDGSCRGENIKVVLKGDTEEKWQDVAGGLRFDGRWVSINIAHFTSVSCAIPRQEYQRDDRFDVLLSTGLTVISPTQPDGAQAVVPGTPTHLHVFITHHDDGLMQDLKQGRLGMPNSEVSRINRVLCSINPLLDLSIEGRPHDFRFSNGNTITVQLNEMANQVTHDVAIAETNRETEFMLMLEFDQSHGLGKSIIEHKVWRTDYSSSVPREIFTKGSLVDELKCSRRHESSRTIPRRPLVPYPITQGVMPQISVQQQPQPTGILEQYQPPGQAQEEAQLPLEQLIVPVMPLENQIAVQIDQIADRVAALQAQYHLLVEVRDHH